MKTGDANGLWNRMSRRRFLRLLSAGGTVAALTACAELESLDSGPSSGMVSVPEPFFFKDTAPFIAHGDNALETRLENLQGVITPVRHFFVRNNAASLDLDVQDWRLAIEGDAIAKPLELTYPEIRELPGRTLVSYLECAGNHRAMFDLVQGKTTQGTQWQTGGISNGEWSGVALREVLTRAGITEEAVSVMLIGLDAAAPEGGFRRVLPVAKAMHPDTLLAYGLNGEILPRDHGFPLRALVPGWVGSSSIKWLGRIVVSAEPLWTRNNTTSYVLIGQDYPGDGERLGPAVTTQTIKSALALPWPAELKAGWQYIYGYAHSPAGSITHVEWSGDGGETWSADAVVEPQFQYSWTRFRFHVNVQPGMHTLMTRATDAMGNTQPATVPFNEKGYLFNQPVPHPIRIL